MTTTRVHGIDYLADERESPPPLTPVRAAAPRPRRRFVPGAIEHLAAAGAALGEALSTRPEYVKCVALDVGAHHPDYGQSWCGRPGVYRYECLSIEEARARGKGTINDGSTAALQTQAEFCFVDASHALLNARADGRLLICPGCAAAMGKALAAGTWEPPTDAGDWAPPPAPLLDPAEATRLQAGRERERAAIVRALAASCPEADVRPYGSRCVLCGREAWPEGNDPIEVKHSPACPWAMARRALGMGVAVAVAVDESEGA